MPGLLGEMVQYQLAEGDVEPVLSKRKVKGTAAKAPIVGMALPAIVVRVLGDAGVNLQVFMDGPDNLWVTSVKPGLGRGQWQPRPVESALVEALLDAPLGDDPGRLVPDHGSGPARYPGDDGPAV